MRIRQFPNKERFRELAKNANVVPVVSELLADTETPVTLLKKMKQNGGPVFLLESVEGGERWGRYSFLGAHARMEVTVYRDNVVISENGNSRTVSHDNDPFPVLKDIMARFKPAIVPELPRFWGGLVGYMSYETVTFIENIPNRLPADMPMARFVVPEDILIFDNVSHTLLITAISFLGDNDAPDSVYETAKERIADLIMRMNKECPHEEPKNAVCKLAPVWPKERYREMVLKVKEHIHAGDVIQAVISQPFQCEAPPDPISLYRAQRYINPSPYLFFLDFGDMSLVGSSPETMVRLENGVATVRPIAGTRQRGRNEQEDRLLADEMLSDEKERAEHLMLVDLGRNDLGRVAETGTVQVTDLMFVERYSHVMHLVSNINCDIMPEFDAFDLFRATFPAGTLSGAPKVRAMEIIDDQEQIPRGPYGGAAGYISFNGNMDLAIVIRTALIENGILTVRAGAGIVADSDPEKERMESVRKARAIEKALEMISEEGN